MYCVHDTSDSIVHVLICLGNANYCNRTYVSVCTLVKRVNTLYNTPYTSFAYRG